MASIGATPCWAGPANGSARIARDSLPHTRRDGRCSLGSHRRKKYDAVMSLFHVVSYLNSDRDLALAFETAAEHLHPGGLFLFDFWYGPAVLSQKPEIGSSAFPIMIAPSPNRQPELRSDEDIVNVNYSLFIEDKASAVLA